MSTHVALLNASYERLGSVPFKHAVRMLFREVAIVEEGWDDRMIGPHHGRPSFGWCGTSQPSGSTGRRHGRGRTCSDATAIPAPTAEVEPRRSTTSYRLPVEAAGNGRTRSRHASGATTARVTALPPKQACRCGSIPTYRRAPSWQHSTEARVGAFVLVAER